MTPGFEEALGLWESGELSRDELSRRFPDEDVAGVLEAFDRMNVASGGPTPDAEAAWAAVRTRLPVRLADRRRGRGKAIRLLAAATIVLLVLGATAYAVVPGVRKAMNDAAGLTAEDPDHSPGAGEPTETGDGSTFEGPDGDATATDPDEGAATEDDAQADADEHEADDDGNAGSSSGTNDDAIEDDSGSGTDDGSVGDGSGSEEDGEAADGESSGSGSEGSD